MLGFYNFPQDSSLNVNVMMQLKLELAYYVVIV